MHCKEGEIRAWGSVQRLSKNQEREDSGLESSDGSGDGAVSKVETLELDDKVNGLCKSESW